MSEQEMNEAEGPVRHTFMAKLTPGPANEVVVFADNFTQAIEKLAARFGKWKTFSMRQLEDEEIIGSAPDDPSALPSADTMRLRSCLSFIRQVAYGENPKALPPIMPDYAEEELQSVIRLRANYERLIQERDRLVADQEVIRLAAKGELPDPRNVVLGTAALQAVVELREEFETFKHTKYFPAPPGPVPTGPPDKVAEAGSEDQSPGGFAVLSIIIDDVETDPGTGNPEAMSGPGKPAEVTGTVDATRKPGFGMFEEVANTEDADAEEGDENAYMAPEVRQAGFRRLTDPDFARPTEPDKSPEGGESDGK